MFAVRISVLTISATSRVVSLGMQVGVHYDTVMMPDITTIGGTVVAFGIASFLVPVLWRDYNLYLSYGPGGLPHNALGWIISGGLLRMMSVEMLSTAQYEKSRDKRSWLPLSLPPRAGSRPQVGSHPVPQRQLIQLPNEDVKSVFCYPCS